MGKLCSLGGKKGNDAVVQSNFVTSNLSSSCFDLFFFIINIHMPFFTLHASVLIVL